jgi:hypothetical protein
LAAIWAERWLKYGGGLVVDQHGGGLQLSTGIWRRSERWRSRHPTLHQRQWHDAWAVGLWRKLSDLATLIPGLREAIIDHVAANGQPYGEGWCMIREHLWEGMEAA